MAGNTDGRENQAMGEPQLNVDKLTAKEAKELLKSALEREGELLASIDGLEKQAEEYKDKWVRGAAEFDNYKKRTAATRFQAEEEGKNSVILKILPIGDNLQRALSMEIDQKTKDGLNMVLRSFNEVLESQGVLEINPIGEPFDPHFHEAVMQCEDGNCQSGSVSEVLLRGYKSGDKVIRYAQVKVVI